MTCPAEPPGPFAFPVPPNVQIVTAIPMGKCPYCTAPAPAGIALYLTRHYEWCTLRGGISQPGPRVIITGI